LHSSGLGRGRPVILVGVVVHLGVLEVAGDALLHRLKVFAVAHFLSEAVRVVLRHGQVVWSQHVLSLGEVNRLKLRAGEHFANRDSVLRTVQHLIADLLVNCWVVN